ncbi:hypothetical protein [Staphylococcus caprae]|uniref:hypothetical protein n=1 Tax=Staphylococcus caprae TaxID=29380 RepID=UPI0024B48820|nr:hypothetical protein [Staphylococcus caprae]MDI9230622.1 hypothetical protein [Staphylococcus caprae]
MMIFIPVTIYGVYLTVQKNKKSLNIFDNDFNAIYITSIIAFIFIILSLINDVKSIRKDFEKVVYEIINTYKLYENKSEYKYNISIWDFWFSLLWIVVMIISLFVIIIY